MYQVAETIKLNILKNDLAKRKSIESEFNSICRDARRYTEAPESLIYNIVHLLQDIGITHGKPVLNKMPIVTRDSLGLFYDTPTGKENIAWLDMSTDVPTRTIYRN